MSIINIKYTFLPTEAKAKNICRLRKDLKNIFNEVEMFPLSLTLVSKNRRVQPEH